MSMLLPYDDNGNPVLALGFDYRGAQAVLVTSASTRNSSPINSDIELVTIIATDACHFEVGDASVAAEVGSSPFLYPGVYVDIPIRRGETHIAFVSAGADCTAYLMGRV
ncbi:MAG: hypothetical protein R3C97_01735 [Geminicoccaceae bacterium]